jgi:hypothetical protein
MPVPSTTMDEEHVHEGGSILATPIGNDRGREKTKERDEKKAYEGEQDEGNHRRNFGLLRKSDTAWGEVLIAGSLGLTFFLLAVDPASDYFAAAFVRDARLFFFFFSRVSGEIALTSGVSGTETGSDLVFRSLG